MTLEATLTRIAEALETLAANSNSAQTRLAAIEQDLAAYDAASTPVQAAAEKPKSDKKGGRPSKKDAAPADAEPSGQDPDTRPLLPGDLPIAPAADIPDRFGETVAANAAAALASVERAEPTEPTEPTEAPASYDDMVKAAHAYAAVGTREVITSILMSLNSSLKLKDVPEALYGQAIVKFNAALAAVNKSTDEIGF